MTATATGFRRIRLLLEQGGEHRLLGRIEFQDDDLSFYVYPMGFSRAFHYGVVNMGEHETSSTFNYTEQLESTSAPHLSFHESGQVHCRSGRPMAGPLHIPRLTMLRGEHVATLCFDRVDNLAPYRGDVGSTPSRFDYVVQADDDVESGKVIVYANGLIDFFGLQRGCQAKIRVERPGGVLHIGLLHVAQEPLGQSGHGPGVTIIGGWDVARPAGPQSYIFLRAT